jgi:hypothetical protein
MKNAGIIATSLLILFIVSCHTPSKFETQSPPPATIVEPNKFEFGEMVISPKEIKSGNAVSAVTIEVPVRNAGISTNTISYTCTICDTSARDTDPTLVRQDDITLDPGESCIIKNTTYVVKPGIYKIKFIETQYGIRYEDTVLVYKAYPAEAMITDSVLLKQESLDYTGSDDRVNVYNYNYDDRYHIPSALNVIRTYLYKCEPSVLPFTISRIILQGNDYAGKDVNYLRILDSGKGEKFKLDNGKILSLEPQLDLAYLEIPNVEVNSTFYIEMQYESHFVYSASYSPSYNENSVNFNNFPSYLNNPVLNRPYERGENSHYVGSQGLGDLKGVMGFKKTIY